MRGQESELCGPLNCDRRLSSGFINSVRKRRDCVFTLIISWDIFAIIGWMDGGFLSKQAIGGLNNIMCVYRGDVMVLIWPN